MSIHQSFSIKAPRTHFASWHLPFLAPLQVNCNITYPMSSTGKSVLVTGCFAGGIGAALAEVFHEKGYHVFATARNPARSQRVSPVRQTSRFWHSTCYPRSQLPHPSRALTDKPEALSMSLSTIAGEVLIYQLWAVQSKRARNCFTSTSGNHWSCSRPLFLFNQGQRVHRAE
jgi:hypothetical protein